ncbi:prephenate dehydrogenase/arogenate dehydrogenase family protein, partial [bacterium]
MPSELPSTIGIVGLGLIGGSIGLALREPGRRIIGHDPNEKAAKTARDRLCVDVLGSLEDAASADVVFVAVPPDVTVDVVERTMTLAGENTVVTDCASVKNEVAAWATKSKSARFVPGHPMAGHEKGGAEYASAWMFRGARWVLTPVKPTATAAVRTVEAAVKAMGATPVRVEAQAHDR